MSVPGDVEQRQRVTAWLRAAPVHELLPPRRGDATPPSTAAEPLDVLSLGPGVALAIATYGDRFVVVPVATDAVMARRAVAGDGVFRSILRMMRAGRSHGAFRGVTIDDGDIALRSGDEFAIDVDQSNDSVVVGGVAVVKVFPITSAGAQPGLDVPVHLASVGFTSIPSPLGALRWTSSAGEEVVLATAASFLPGARDGWEWYLACLLAWLDGELGDASFEPAQELGRLAARMHTALATPSPSMPQPTDLADRALADRWRREALAVLEEALELTDGDEGSRLAARAGTIRAELQRLGDGDGVVTTRVHGDFHVGQVLEWDGGFAVADFDGNPMAPPEARVARDTPVRDVAAFARSIDHLGRVASTRRPGRDEAIESWIASSRARFLDAYREELGVRGAARLFDERLLRPLEIAQECHEYVYAARFLPRWRYVPDLAIQTLIPSGAVGPDAAG